MIERIEWNRYYDLHKLPNPFMTGERERPIRITLHSECLKGLSGKPMEAVALLREFGNLPQIDLLETEPGNSPSIEIEPFDLTKDVINVRIVSTGGVTSLWTGIHGSRQWPNYAAFLVGQQGQNHPSTNEMVNAIKLSQAHYKVGSDILVTLDPLILEHRDKSLIREANPRTPTEAAQIVGLFLRSRNIYTYMASSKVRSNFSRGLFYWILARYRLPSMWRYFSACVAAGKERSNGLQSLGSAILIRSVRALEARDAIGIQFYLPQNNETRDQMMYHFDYLTLVLTGAFDAQARITNNIYQLGCKGISIAFQRKGFVDALASKDAKELHNFISSQRFKDTMTLLNNLRNTIHAANLETIGYHVSPHPEQSRIKVPVDIEKAVWEAAERLGSANRWGLSKEPWWTLLEPYSYSIALIEESFSAINSIASATDVGRLFSEQATPKLLEAAPLNSEFQWGERISLLA